MNKLSIQILVATVPLLLLIGACTLSEIIKKHYGKRTIKRITVGALKGLAQGPHLKF